jgi:F-type H+-transporting ATPase subunit delta
VWEINISKRYAKSLERLIPNDLRKPFYKDYKLFLDMVDNTMLRYIMFKPSVTFLQKINILKKIFSDKKCKFNNLFCKFVYTLAKNGRTSYINLIFKIYSQNLNKHLKILNIEIRSPEKKCSTLLSNTLMQHFNKNVCIEYLLDRTIIGGFRIKIGNYIIDNSVINNLNNLKKELLNTHIK